MPARTLCRQIDPGLRDAEIAALVAATFAASEGAEEGRIVGGLAEALLRGTPPQDLRVFVTEAEGRLIAAGLFSRLTFAKDPREAFLLGPMAVDPAWQGQGLGQALLRHALDALCAAGTDFAVTYGDPDFYGRVGFRPVTMDEVPPPMPLSMPQGWIAQALDGQPLRPFRGPSTCVPALQIPEAW